MNYLEFKQSAKKHYYTSKCLFNNCKDNWQIQENIFYLCGYVIEMMIKYEIFKRIEYDKREDIKRLNRNNLTYKEHIQKHNIRLLVNKLRQYNNAIILDEVLKIFDKWDVSIRYNGKRKNYDNLEKLLDLSKKIIEKFGG